MTFRVPGRHSQGKDKSVKSLEVDRVLAQLHKSAKAIIRAKGRIFGLDDIKSMPELGSSFCVCHYSSLLKSAKKRHRFLEIKYPENEANFRELSYVRVSKIS